MQAQEKRIGTLVVDNSPLVLHAICSFLEDQPGVRVVGFTSDGLEALTLAAKLQPGLVLLDAHLPPLNGFRNGLELASQFAKDFPAILVVMVTAFDTSWPQTRLARWGAYGIVSKLRIDKDLPGLLDQIRFLRASTDLPDKKLLC